jgi:hypothetical protein
VVDDSKGRVINDEFEYCVAIPYHLINSSASLSSQVFIYPIIQPIKRRKNRQKDLRNTGNIINMITQRHEQVKKKLTTTSLHLHLHSPATLEGSSAADYESKVMSSKLRVVVGCVGIGIAG